MTRLLVLCADYGIPLNGTKGASIHLRSIATALADQGASVAVACRSAAAPPYWRLPVFPLPDRPRPSDAEFTPEEMNARDAEALEEIHARFPFEAIYERSSLWAVAGLETARERRIPLTLEVNAPLALEASRWRSLPFHDAAVAAETRLAREAERLLPVSDPLARHLEQLGADPRRIDVVQNGVDSAFLRVGQERFAKGANDVRPRPRTRIVFVGSLKPWHGIDVLLEAYALLARASGRFALRIIGDGPERERVRAAVAADSSITWSGPLAHETIPAELRAADLAVAPYLEGDDGYFSPLKVFEYQAAGLPVVASGGPGVRAAVQDGAAGVLVPAADAAALAAAIESLHDDPARAEELALAGWRAAGQRSWQANARRVLAPLDALVVG